MLLFQNTDGRVRVPLQTSVSLRAHRRVRGRQKENTPFLRGPGLQNTPISSCVVYPLPFCVCASSKAPSWFRGERNTYLVLRGLHKFPTRPLYFSSVEEGKAPLSHGTQIALVYSFIRKYVVNPQLSAYPCLFGFVAWIGGGHMVCRISSRACSPKTNLLRPMFRLCCER